MRGVFITPNTTGIEYNVETTMFLGGEFLATNSNDIGGVSLPPYVAGIGVEFDDVLLPRVVVIGSSGINNVQ